MLSHPVPFVTRIVFLLCSLVVFRKEEYMLSFIMKNKKNFLLFVFLIGRRFMECWYLCTVHTLNHKLMTKIDQQSTIFFLLSWPTFSLSGNMGNFLDWRTFGQSINFVLFLNIILYYKVKQIKIKSTHKKFTPPP